MDDPKSGAEHESHLHGPVSGPVHSGSGDIHYNVTVSSGRETVLDVSRLETLYAETIYKRSDLSNMRTPLGSVEIDQLYVMPQLAPVAWIYGDRPDQDDGMGPEPALNVIERFRRVVIFGAPGIGKSTFLKYVLHRMLAGSVPDSFPIFVPLYQFAAQQDQDLMSFAIEHYFRPLYQGEDLEALGLLLRHWQSEGKLVFLLDGLDEVPSDKRETLLGQIRSLPRYVLTSRPRGWVDANQESGANYDILPFAHNEVARFVRKWQDFQAQQVSPETFSAAEFFNYIRRETRIADLVRIPQLLTILCWLWGRGGAHQYGTKGELLVEAADRLIDKAIALSNLSEESRLTRSRDLRRGLSGLALEMLRQSRLTISTEEFIEFFELAQISDLGELLMLAQRSGLLVPTSGRRDEWQFIHLVFQEYLAAEALVRHPDFESVLDQLVGRVDFEECLRIASGLLCDSRLQRYAPRLETLIDKLMGEENTDIFFLNWRLAGLCVSEVNEPERRLGERVAHLEAKLLECASEWWARQRFTDATGRLRTDGMRQRLVEALAHDDPYVRWAAAAALSEMADPATLDAILARIDEEGWHIVKSVLIATLGRIGDPRALPKVQEMLAQPDVGFTIWQGIGEALGRFEDIETLSRLALAEEETGEYGFSKTAVVLLSAHPYLSDEAQAVLHRTLDESGASIWGGPADAYLLDEPTIEELTERAQADDPAERLEAVRALGRAGSQDALYVLTTLLLDEDETVCRAAGKMLRTMTEDGEALVYSFFVVLILTLKAEEVEDREIAAEIAAQLWTMPEEREMLLGMQERLRAGLAGDDDESLDQELLDLLTSDQPFLVPAIWALGSIGEPAYASKLAGFLKHDDDIVRWVTAWALGELGGPEAREALLECLRQEEVSEVLQTAARSAAKLGLAEAAGPLIELLERVSDPPVRQAAITSLKELQATDAIAALLKALDDPEAALRAMAAEALGELGTDQAVPTLIKSLDDPDLEVQISAATALGALKDLQAQPALIRCLTSKDPDLRHAAIESLLALDAGAAAEHLLPLIETDPDEECASAAANAYGELTSADGILALIELFGDKRDSVRMNAVASALGSADEPLRDQILQRLEEKDVLGRVAHNATAIQLRGDWGVLTTRSELLVQQYGETDEEQLKGCLESLFHEDELVRWEAAVALNDMENPISVASLIVTLIDQDFWVVTAAAQALETISQNSPLTQQIRSERARALAYFRDQDVLGDLVGWLEQFEIENDWLIPQTIRWSLQDALALETLVQAYTERKSVQVRVVLWEIGAQHNLRFMPNGEVVLPSGERVSCQEATQRLLSSYVM